MKKHNSCVENNDEPKCAVNYAGKVKHISSLSLHLLISRVGLDYSVEWNWGAGKIKSKDKREMGEEEREEKKKLWG